MYLATLKTRNFDFLVIDKDEESAKNLLRQAWNRHQEQTDAEWDWDFVSDSVFVTFIRCGDVLRDGELMHTYDTPNGWN